MSARCMLAAAAALIAAPAAAQDAAPDSVAELADRFERAMVAGDYRVLPLAEDFTYTENGARLDPWDGMWRTLTAVEGAVDFPELDYRVELASGDTAVRVVEFEENTVQGVMAYRLVARDGRIASVEVLPVREEFGGDRGGTLTLLQPMLPATMDGERVGPSSIGLAASAPLDPAVIARTIGYYFSAYGDDRNRADYVLPNFTADCVRSDNGQRVTGLADAPLIDPASPAFRPFALSCEEQLASGFYANYRPASPALFVDPERRLGIAFLRLDQPGTVLSFTAPDGSEIAYPGPRGAVEGADIAEQFDGRILTNMITPMSVNGVSVFQFDDNGLIARIEAFYRGAPLGWDAVP